MVALALIALALALRLFAMTPMATSLLERQLERTTISGQQIELTGFKGDLLGRMTLDRLTVSDPDGVWLEAERVELAWSPLRLLFNHVKLSTLSLERLALTRHPQLAPSATTEQSTDFLHWRYQLQSLRFDRLVVSEGVAGPAQTYRINGAADARLLRGQVDLTVIPADTSGDTASLAFAWGGNVPFSGEVRASGPASGLFAQALGAPAGDDISATLEASGSILDWRWQTDVTSGDKTVLNARGALNDGVYATSGALQLQRWRILQPLAKRLGTALRIEGRYDVNGALTARAEADTGVITISGLVSELSNRATIKDFRADIGGLAPSKLFGVSALEMPEIALAGQLDLGAETQAFDGVISIPLLKYGSVSASTLRSTGQLTHMDGVIGIAAQLTSQSITGLPSALDESLSEGPSADLTGAIDLAARSIELETVSVRAAESVLSATGRLGARGPIGLNGEMDLKGLAPLAGFRSTWSVRGASLQSLALAFDGRAQFPAGPSLLADLIGPEAQVSGQAQLNDRTLQIASLQLSSNQLSAAMAGSASPDALDLEGEVRADDLILPGVELPTFDMAFSLTGAPSAPILGMTAKAAPITLAGQLLEAPRATAQLQFADTIAYAGEVSAIFQDAPLKLVAEGGVSGQAVDVAAITAEWAAFNARGDGEVNLSDIAQSRASIAVSGGAFGLAKVDGALVYRDQSLESEIGFDELMIGPIYDGRGTLNLTGAWPMFSGDLDVTAQTEWRGSAHPISAQNALRLNAAAQSLQIEGRSRVSGKPITITSPIEIGLQSGLNAKGEVAAFGGDIGFELDASGQSVSRLRLDNIAVAEIGPLIQRPALTGRLNGEAELQLAETGIVGAASARLTRFGRAVTNTPTANMALEATVTDNQLNAVLNLSDEDDSLKLVADLQTQLAHRETLFSIRPAPGAPMPIRVSGEGPITPIWSLAAPPDLRLEGDLQLDVSNGTGEDFRFSGPVTFKDGVFEDGFTGLHLQEIDALAELDTDGVSVESASAVGARGGRVSASGRYRFDGQGAVALDLDRLQAFNRSDIAATLSGQGSVTRRDRRTRVEGDLQIDEARLDLSKLPSAGYTTLDVRFLTPEGEQEIEAPVREAVSLTVNVKADRRIFISGLGVDSEWGLDARVTGPMGQPNIRGSATLIRGEADLLSRRFRLSTGRVRFVGAPEDSEVFLQANRSSGGFTSTITIEGDVLDPEIRLSANPSVPEDEILSRVLFGRSPSELSPLQAAQLAGAAAQLAGGDAINLTGQLEAATGLDRLDIGLDDQGDATLATGKYLADDIYLEVQSGASGAPGLALEWTPLSNVEVEAEVDPELGPKVAIQWKRDFDRLPGEPAPSTDGSD